MFNVLFFLHSPSFPGSVRHRCTVAHAERSKEAVWLHSCRPFLPYMCISVSFNVLQHKDTAQCIRPAIR